MDVSFRGRCDSRLRGAGGAALQAPDGGGKGADKAAEPKTAASKIVKVVVYPNSALVTREVEVPAGDGVAELVVSPLPQHVVQSSLYSEGGNGIRILSTRFRTRQVLEDTREDVRKLEDELKKLHLSSQKLVAESKAIEQNMAMLGKLEGFTTVTTISSTEKGGLNGDTVITLAKYVMEQRADKTKELVDMQQKLDTLKEQTDFAQRKLNELTAGTSKIERDAVIVVDRANGGGGKVRLNYLVDAASWRPQYKFRAGKPNEAVQIEYLAALVQQTGEDWTNVDLTLSTAQPMLNAAPPELAKLEVAVVARVQRADAQADRGKPARATMPPSPTKARARSGEQGQGPAQARPRQLQNNFKERRPGEVQLAAQRGRRLRAEPRPDQVARGDSRRPEAPAIARPARGNDGPSVTYHLTGKLTVPRRNDEQVIEVAKLDLTPKYYYKAVPVLNRTSTAWPT